MKETHIARMLYQRVAQYQDREALRFKDNDTYKSISWKTFGQQAQAIANFLNQQGVKYQDNVGIYSQNYPNWTIADLGILSLRGVVVPIFPTSPLDQLKYIVDETAIKVLFVGDEEQLKIASQLFEQETSLNTIITFNCKPRSESNIFSFDEIVSGSESFELNGELKKELDHADSEDLATIIYTSGTTGEPKGAMLTHKNFMSSFRIHSQRLELGESDVSMCFLPLSHVFERTWTYFVLYSGAVNVYNSDPKKIMEELPKVKPTVMCTVPRLFEKTHEGIISTAKQWSLPQQKIFYWALNVGYKQIEYKKDGKTPPLGLRIQHALANKLVMKKVQLVFGGNIKYIPCAGAKMSGDLVRFFHALGIFVNYGYGATETLATVSCMRSDKYDFDYTGSIMPDVQVKIGENNMILVKGDTVFKGYYKKPKETAETLIDGWYHTGDEGFLPEKGTLHMTERIKDIIKTSTGKYVSPQKIEGVLMQSELIDQLCVIGDNKKYLSALIVPPYHRLQQIAESQGIQIYEGEDLNKNADVLKIFEHHLQKHQKDLAPFEKVVKFTFVEEPFSIENLLLTNSLKVRRRAVNKAYAKEIAEMYN